jgi:hypothetical protein
LFFVALIGASVWFGIDAANDWQRFYDKPIELDVGSAVAASSEGRQWVSVSSAGWRCDQAIQRGVSTFVPVWAEAGDVLVAEFQFPVVCDVAIESPVAGIVESMPAYLTADLAARGLVALNGQGVHLLKVSNKNERDDVRLGVILCSLGVVLAFALFPLRGLTARFHARNHVRLVAAAFAPEESPEANRTIRRHGAMLVVFALAAFFVGEGWVIGGFIPVRWFAAAAVFLGSGMIVFHLQYRRLHRKGWLGKR